LNHFTVPSDIASILLSQIFRKSRMSALEKSKKPPDPCECGGKQPQTSNCVSPNFYCTLPVRYLSPSG
jgi:hypothetical protein